MAWTIVVLPVLECRSPGTSREVQNSNDGNITKQRGEASEPTNHPTSIGVSGNLGLVFQNQVFPGVFSVKNPLGWMKIVGP